MDETHRGWEDVVVYTMVVLTSFIPSYSDTPCARCERFGMYRGEIRERVAASSYGFLAQCAYYICQSEKCMLSALKNR
jgi:hypothetical protein